MTYVPIIVPSSSPEPVDTDRRDLVTALKLLSGEGCVRDAQQAQVILVGLTESHHPDVAHDAQALMQAGLKEGWFETTVPKYFTLCTLAERSLRKAQQQGGASQQLKLALSLLVGLVALGVGVFAYIGASGMQPPWVLIALVSGLLVVGLVPFLMKRND